ncbi:hypothetical protein CRYUN_Cryun05aG0142500 [Craigia yunnanensis]
MDEIATEALKCRVEADHSKSSTSKVQQLILTSLGQFEKEIESKLEKIIDRLEYIAEQKDALGLRTMYGRDADREEIMKLLLWHDSSSNGVSVIAIVSMGGVCKATLAQLVYNDEMVDVPSIVQPVPAYHLKELLDEDCWRLLAKHAFGGQSSNASLELEVIGREIVIKCKGLPLAAKVLDGLLRSKSAAE